MPVARSLVGKDACSEKDGTSTSSTPVGVDLDDEKDAAVSPRAPSWEKMVELLKRVPCYTEVEPPSTKMSDFFPLTKWVHVEIDDNPPFLSQPGSHTIL